MHNHVYPPLNSETVIALAGDGHEKVLTRICHGDAVPMKSPEALGGGGKPFTNGWFDGRVLSMEQQIEPENNAVVTKAFEKVVHLYRSWTASLWIATVSMHHRIKVVNTTDC